MIDLEINFGNLVARIIQKGKMSAKYAEQCDSNAGYTVSMKGVERKSMMHYRIRKTDQDRCCLYFSLPIGRPLSSSSWLNASCLFMMSLNFSNGISKNSAYFSISSFLNSPGFSTLDQIVSELLLITEPNSEGPINTTV